MAKKQYENFTVFGARIYGMRNLWTPSTEYMGKPTQRPNYIAGFITPKTRAHWSEEPVFAGVWAAMQKIYAATMQGMPYNMVDWPIRDGDMPAPGKPQAEWARGHWMFGGNSSEPVKVEIVQNGTPVPLINRATVKPGDYVTVAGATAQKSNDPRGIKFYINTVLFVAPGEEIAVGNSISGAELMAAAQAQGLQVAGFSTAPAAFAGGGFAPGGAPGFSPPNNGSARGQAVDFHPGNPATNTAPGQFGTGGNGNAAFPSNPGQQQFAPNGQFQSPPNFAPGGPAPQQQFAPNGQFPQR